MVAILGVIELDELEYVDLCKDSCRMFARGIFALQSEDGISNLEGDLYFLVPASIKNIAPVNKVVNLSSELYLDFSGNFMENKKELLADAARSCIKHGNNVELISQLGLSEDAIIQAYIDYDYDIFSFDNSIYSSKEMRMVMHLHNSLKDSWHAERQDTIYQFLQIVNPSSVMDVGFGIPSSYIRKFIEKKDLQITLSDFSESAKVFASQLLDQWSSDWSSHIHFLIEDMAETSLHPPKQDVYLFPDSIEHVENPTACLHNFVRNSHSDAKFIFSLPIGPKIPVHNIAWDSAEEIRIWLQSAGLRILLEKEVKVNPKVDLFAEQVNFSFVNLIVLCDKLPIHAGYVS